MVSLVPLATTPMGVVMGQLCQRVGVALEGLAPWIDHTFPQDDERAFVASLHDLELLVRAGWHAEPPESFDERDVLNVEDVPEDVLEALHEAPVELVACAICRRLCVRDDFLWNDRRLCAWDYHATVFGRRGPWRHEPYVEHHLATLPAPRYLTPALLHELGVVVVASMSRQLEESVRFDLMNRMIAADPGGEYLGVRTESGLTLLREGTVAVDSEATIETAAL